MRILLDTNVLARAARPGRGPARELLERCLLPPHILCLSPIVLDELSRVLRYPRLIQQHQLSESGIIAYLESLESAAFMVPVADLNIVPIVRDPDDDAIIATAVAAKSDFLATRDRHLTTAAVREYCSRHGIELIDDLDLLRSIRGPAE